MKEEYHYSKKETTFRAMVFSAFAFALIGFAKILFNIIVSRSFGADSIIVLGMSNVALSFALLISMICSSGFSNAINKFISDSLSRNDRASARTIYDRILSLNSLIILPISFLILVFHKEIAAILQIGDVYVLLSLGIAVTSNFYYLLRAAMYSLNETRQYLAREFLSNIFFFSILILSIIFLSPEYILCSFSGMYLLFIFLAGREINKKLLKTKKHHKIAIGGIETYAGLTTVGTILSVSLIYLASLCAGAFLGATEAALFAAAYSTASIILMIPNVISMVLLPRMSFSWGKNDTDSIRNGISFWTHSLIIICALIIIPFGIFGKTILTLLFGDQYSIAHMTLILILIGIFFQTASRPSTIALVSTRYIHITASVSAIAFIVAILTWLIAVQYFGIIGIALGFMLAAIINSCGSIFFAELQWRSGFRQYLLPIGSAILLLSLLSTIIEQDGILIESLSSMIFIILFTILNIRFIRTFFKEIRHI